MNQEALHRHNLLKIDHLMWKEVWELNYTLRIKYKYFHKIQLESGQLLADNKQ